jgi:hypothetical protein
LGAVKSTASARNSYSSKPEAACDKANKKQKQKPKQENEQGMNTMEVDTVERSQVPIAERTPGELVNLIKKLRWVGLEEEAA